MVQNYDKPHFVHPWFTFIIQSSLMSVRLSLKILVTTEPFGFYFSRNIPTGPVVVLSYFLGGWDIPQPFQKNRNPPPKKMERKLPPHGWAKPQ